MRHSLWSAVSIFLLSTTACSHNQSDVAGTSTKVILGAPGGDVESFMFITRLGLCTGTLYAGRRDVGLTAGHCTDFSSEVYEDNNAEDGSPATVVHFFNAEGTQVVGTAEIAETFSLHSEGFINSSFPDGGKPLFEARDIGLVRLRNVSEGVPEPREILISDHEPEIDTNVRLTGMGCAIPDGESQLMQEWAALGENPPRDKVLALLEKYSYGKPNSIAWKWQGREVADNGVDLCGGDSGAAVIHEEGGALRTASMLSTGLGLGHKWCATWHDNPSECAKHSACSPFALSCTDTQTRTYCIPSELGITADADADLVAAVTAEWCQVPEEQRVFGFQTFSDLSSFKSAVDCQVDFWSRGKTGASSKCRHLAERVRLPGEAPPPAETTPPEGVASDCSGACGALGADGQPINNFCLLPVGESVPGCAWETRAAFCTPGAVDWEEGYWQYQAVCHGTSTPSETPPGGETQPTTASNTCRSKRNGSLAACEVFCKSFKQYSEGEPNICSTYFDGANITEGTTGAQCPWAVRAPICDANQSGGVNWGEGWLQYKAWCRPDDAC